MTNLSFDLDALINSSKKKSAGPKMERLEADKTADYRILSSINPNNRDLNHTYVVHWVVGPNGKKLTVACTYFTERFCPICKRHREVEDALKHAEASGNAELIKDLKEAEEALRSSKFVAYAAVNRANELVILSLSSTVSNALIGKIAEAAKDKAFDPTSPTQGVWFRFKKVGKGRDSVTVDFAKQTIDKDGETYEKLDRSPLPNELVTAIATNTPDVHSARNVWVKVLPSTVIAKIANGNPLDAADLGYDTTPKASEAAAPAASAPATQAPAQSAPAAQAPATNTATPPSTPTVATEAPAAPAPAATAPTPTTPNASAPVSSTAAEIANLRKMLGKKPTT